MSDYISNEEVDSKLSLVVRKPQEGKTFICISYICDDKNKKIIHIVLTMNTLSAGMQFFGRMVDKVGSKKIIVFNSKKETAGDCHYAKTVDNVVKLVKTNPDIKVIVCCAHEKRIRESITEIIKECFDSIPFREANRSFSIHIDEAHKYISENREYIRSYNKSPLVNTIIGYSATPDGIWSKDTTDPLFHKILIRNVEAELELFRSPDYFGVHCCESRIFEEEMTYNDIVSLANISTEIPLVVQVRANSARKNWHDGNQYFDHGDEILLLSYIDQIIPRMQISPDTFSYHFVPAYTCKVTHYGIVEILLKHCPNANVISSNGNGYDLYRKHPSSNQSYNVKSGNHILRIVSAEQCKKLLEPSNMIQELIKDTSNCPTFVTGLLCVGMSVTLVNESIGNFDSVVMAHQHYKRDKLYQLCRFLFNYMNWSPEARSKIKKTQFYSLTKFVFDTCLGYQESVERMSTDFAGKTCSLREIHGLEPEEPSVREMKKMDMKTITLINSATIWKKFKVYEGNDGEEWKKVEDFYESIKKKKLLEKCKSRPKCIDGFYHCSGTGVVLKQPISKIIEMYKHSWDSTFALTSTSLSYIRIFVGYDNLDDPSEYTIFVKYAQLENTVENRSVLKKYFEKKPKQKVEKCSSDTASEEVIESDSISSDDEA